MRTISRETHLAPGWQQALDRAARWSPPPWDDTSTAALVVVPHPDDEAVLFGGLIARLAARGTPVHVLAVTDGGAAYPGIVDEHELAAVRRQEQVDAVAALGVTTRSILRLGLPDGAVAEHEPTVRTAIAAMMEDVDVGMIVAPWQHDHHTDHEACGRAAVSALHSSVGPARRPVVGAFGLFWSMQRDPHPAGVELAAMTLTATERRRKLAAIDLHRTQISPLFDAAPFDAAPFDAAPFDTVPLDAVPLDPVLGPAELAVCAWPKEHYVIDLGPGWS